MTKMDTIDYTRKRLGSKVEGRTIARCPKCGRKGQRTIYKDSDQNFIHVAHKEMGFWAVTDNCFIKAEAAH